MTKNHRLIDISGAFVLLDRDKMPRETLVSMFAVYLFINNQLNMDVIESSRR